MNYYFLLEDEKSFIKVLPKWLEYMGFYNKRVADISEITEDCYVMQSGQGVTQLITRALFQTIDTIFQNAGKVDQLIVILDSEQYNVEYRKNEVKKKIEDYVENQCIKLDFTYKIFVCNHCFETWLLGNSSLFPSDNVGKNKSFWIYYNHYNVKENDPENMLPPIDVYETIASYHFHYLHELCRYNRIKYTKKKPEIMSQKSYFDEIVKRINSTPHLKTKCENYNYFTSLETV